MTRAGTDPTRTSALLALLLLVPVPTIGVAAALYTAPGTEGRVVFVVSKIWLLLFPLVWHLMVERGTLGWSPPRRGGFGVGVMVGTGMAAAIVGSYAGGLRGLVDPQVLARAVEEMGLAGPGRFLAAAASWIFVNSLVEEYVWRWFVLRQLRALLPDAVAVLASAAAFTLHHTVAMASYLGPSGNALASLGVLAAGACWSWLYLRFDSIWPGWMSHVIADVAIFGLGWYLLFE